MSTQGKAYGLFYSLHDALQIKKCFSDLMHWTPSSPNFINEETGHRALECQSQKG